MDDAERRRMENAALIARMKRGESLARCDTQATWWPPRPIIKKDKAEMAKLYGTEDQDGSCSDPAARP